MPSSAKHSTERSGVVSRIVEILEAFTLESPRLPLRTIAERACLPASTVRRLLIQLEGSGLVIQDPQSQLYQLTMKLSRLGDVAASSANLESVARAPMERLAAKTGEGCFLGRLEGDEVLYLSTVQPYSEVRLALEAGDRRQANTTALGAVILAARGASVDRESVWSHEILERFGASLEQIREQGFVIGVGGRDRESLSVAVLLRTGQEQPNEALAISGPAYRFGREQAEAVLADLQSEASVINDMMDSSKKGKGQ